MKIVIPIRHNMESISALQSLSMEKEKYLEEAYKVALWLTDELDQMFDHHQYNAKAYIARGNNPFLKVVITNAPLGSHEARQANPDLRLEFTMPLNRGDKYGSMFNFKFELGAVSIGVLRKGLKFKTMEGISPMSAAKKLLIWILANEIAIRQISGEYQTEEQEVA